MPDTPPIRYGMIFRAMTEAAVLIDAGGHIERANLAALRLWPELDQGGGPLALLDHLSGLAHLARQRGHAITEVQLGAGDADLIVELSASQVPELDRTVVLIRDVTALARIGAALEQARDEAVQASRLKSQFVATMSHEIRTPLNGLMGMLQLLQRTSLSDHQTHLVERSQQSARLLLNLINDVLDFSRIEAGHLALSPRPTVLADVIERSLQPAAVAAERRQLELVLTLDPALPSQVELDGDRLAQLLVNLVGNAVKFTEQGHVHLTFRPTEDPEGIEFHIEDTGCGVPSDQQERIFEQFTQLPHLSGQSRGTGLGLAISRAIVERMGGRLWLSASSPAGSTFSVWLPAAHLHGAQTCCLRPPPRGHVLLLCRPATAHSLVPLLHSWGLSTSTTPGAPRPTPLRYLLWDPLVPGAEAHAHELTRSAPAAGAPPLRSIALLSPSQLGAEGTSPHASHWLTQPILPDALCRAMNRSHPPLVREPPAPPPTDAPTLEVLVVDDNEINREVAEGLVRARGHRVTTASGGLEGLARLRGRRWDAVLLDIEMPDLSGPEVLRRFHAGAPGAVPRIVALTAHAMTGIRAQLLSEGFDDYIAKPLQWSDLARALAPLEQAPPPRDVSPASVGGPEECLEERTEERPAGLDPALLLDRTGGDLKRAHTLAALFLKHSGARFQALEEALTEGRHEDGAALAHSLRSMCSHFRSPAASPLERAESAARSGDGAAARAALPTIEAGLQETCRDLEALLQAR